MWCDYVILWKVNQELPINACIPTVYNNNNCWTSSENIQASDIRSEIQLKLSLIENVYLIIKQWLYAQNFLFLLATFTIWHRDDSVASQL